MASLLGRISVLLLVLPGVDYARAQETVDIRLEVDARDASRNILHSRLAFPAKSGPLSLSYPRWIQGEHAPTGPITDTAGLVIRGGGSTLKWQRDPVDMYTVHLVVPEGATEIVVDQDFLLPSGTSGFTSSAASTDHLCMLSWNQVVLFPKGIPANRVRYTPSVMLNEAWQFATALAVEKKEKGFAAFQPVDLTTLIDSPMLMGRHFKTVTLNDAPPFYFLEIAADSTEALEIKPEAVAQLKKLVAELGALFGSHPHREYRFLLSLSDHVAHFGLEHHESTDIRYAERTFVESDLYQHFMPITPHEAVHSWNGKYRRPAGLVRGTPNESLEGELLWVYEGLTTYLGYVLAARSGIWSAEVFRDCLAQYGTRIDLQAGRSWRPLVDTCVAAQLLYPSATAGSSWRRGVDFYDEGALIWLEADVLIRRESNGAASLDDFCRRFFGGQNGAPAVKPYDLQEVIATLTAVHSYDWKSFFEERVYKVAPRAPFGGILNSGWRVSSTNEVTAAIRAWNTAQKGQDLAYSIGLQLADDGSITEVVKGLAASEAGLVPGGRILAVNGRRWTPDVLRTALRASSERPVELLVERQDFFHTYSLKYTGGERYPVLVRDTGTPDLLSRITAPVSKP